MNSRLLRYVSIFVSAISVPALLVTTVPVLLAISLWLNGDSEAAAAGLLLSVPFMFACATGLLFGLAGATLADMADDVKTLRIVGYGSSG